MARLSQAKNAFLLWTLVLAFCAVGFGAAGGTGPASGNPLSVIPADSLFCLRINKLGTTLGQVDQFLAGVSPVPVNVSLLAPMQLGKLLGSVEPKGINMAGDFAIFGLLPGGETPNPSRIGVLVPVSDYEQFTKGNPNVTPPDAQGISRIGEGEQKMFAAVKAGSYTLVTAASNQQALTEMKNWISGTGTTPLSQRLSPEELKWSSSAPVWAYANVQTASKMFGPMIQAKLQEARKGMEEAQKQGQPMPGQMGAVMDMYAGMLNVLMQETQSVSLSLDPTATAIRAGFVTGAVPNSEMAKIFQGDSGTPDRKFLQYLENGAIMNLIVSINPASWNRLNSFYIDLMAKFVGKDPASEEVRNLKKLTTDATNALTGTLAASFSMDLNAKPPFKLQEVVGIKDPQAFYRVLDESSKMLESGLVADLMKNLGMKFKFELKRKAETYKDVPIDAIKLGMEMTDPNSPESKMMAAMYGEGMEGRIAIVNNLLVYTVAQDPGPLVRKLIDQVKGGGTQAVPSEVQAAMQLIPGSEKAGFFATYNYLRVLQMVTAIMPLPIPRTAVQSQSNIAIAGKAAGGNLTIDLALPKQHLVEIMTVFMQMQQKMQEQQPGQPQPPQAQPPRPAQPKPPAQAQPPRQVQPKPPGQT
jgi:hypothetical protein